MGELNKKWFQNVWLCLLLASVTITYIQRWSDAQWAHGAGIEMLNTVLTWIILPLTVILLVCKYIGYWCQSKRLFWKKCRFWGGFWAIGTVWLAALVLLVDYIKGGDGTIDDSLLEMFSCTFVVCVVIYAIARYKFNHWRKEEE